MQPKLKVEMARTNELVPYASNAKEHPDWQVQQIANSIKQFGFSDPVGVWTNSNGQLEIVEGHGRILAAKELGIERVPIIRLDHLDNDARRAYVHVHNQTTLTSGFDNDTLQAELEALSDFDWGAFGFDFDADWFEARQRFDTSREEGNDEYNEFLEKFEPKKTTDDCYTPDAVYDAVADWVAAEYGISRSRFVRPFYPDGDYENEKYPKGCAVVDNPPFSLLASIIRFYCEHNIRFFLFAPALTLFSARNQDVCCIPCNCDVTYENGANVSTSFITNMQNGLRIMTAPSLYEAVTDANRKVREEQAKPVNLKYKYPPYVVTAAIVGNWASCGVDFRVPSDEAVRVSQLDAQKEYDKAIFGGGFLLSERAKAEAERAKAEAERAKAEAERAKALEAAKALGDGVEVESDGSVVWRLSDRERQIVASISKEVDE